MKDNKLMRAMRSWLGILAGSTILAAGFVFFINPYDIVPGGVYGLCIVLHKLFPGIQVGTYGYMFDIPLLILSMLLLGKRLGARTLVAALITPLIMNVISTLVYPTQEALQTLDPTLLLNGKLNMTNHLMLAVVIGSAMIGLGSGIVVRSGATTGGSDIIGMMMQKYLHIRFSRAILMVDGMVVLCGLIVIGLAPDAAPDALFLSLYSLFSIYLISRVIARTINGSKDDKVLQIISGKPMQVLHDYILKDLDRTATVVQTTGLYSGQEREMLILVVSYKEVQGIKQKVRDADPQAFVIVSDAYDAFGEGWKPLPHAGDVMAE